MDWANINWANDSLDPSAGFRSSADSSLPAKPDFFSMESLLGNATQKGWGGLALQGLGGAAGLFMGMQQYGLAKNALAQAKEQYAKNYAAQQATTNSALNDRQIARNAAGPGYQDTASYMAQYGIKS